MQSYKLENENQACLLVFCRYFRCIMESVQNYVNQRTELLIIILSLYAAQLGAKVVCAQAEKDLIPQKLAK